MGAVSTRVVGCRVRLDWVAPKHFEQENIEDFKIEIQTHDGTWAIISIDSCETDLPLVTWGTLENSCTVGMETLSSAPYLLDDSDFLYVRAKASY
jgi:hypothetical protein